MILAGKRLYGPHDHVPGLGHVRTLFVHIWWIPLLPMGTYLVLGEDTDAPAVKLPFSFKALAFAYARVGLFLVGLACALLVLPLLADVFDSLSGSGSLEHFLEYSLYVEHLLILLGPGLTIPAYIGLGRWMRQASPERAEELRSLLA